MNAQAKIAKTLTAAVMITALTVSFMHIVITFDALGSGWDKWIAPVMIDVIAIVGKIYSGTQYTAATRRLGRRAFYVAGTLSLIANVLAGYFAGHYGSMIIGVLTVSAAIWGEYMINLGQVQASARKVNRDGRTAEQVKRDEINARRRAQRAARKATVQQS